MPRDTSGRMVLRASGIASIDGNDHLSPEERLRVWSQGKKVRFCSIVHSGPVAARDRQLWVTLSRPDLAALVGSIPAIEMADPEVAKAFALMRRFLMSEPSP